MTHDLVFYTNPMSRGRIVRWMLEEVGRPYRTEFVDFGPAMKRPEYRTVNPMGKVPAIRHADTVVTECAAICAYLADAFPDAGLAPPQEKRGPYYRWLFFAAGPLEQATTNASLGFEVPEDKRGMVGYGGVLSTVIDTLETGIPAEGWIAGPDFSAADVYVGSHIAWGMQQGAIPKRPAFERYVERLSARPAMGRAMGIDDKAMAERAA